jgi:hypothetical protein
MMSYKDFVDPESLLRDALDQELAHLEAQFAGRRSLRDRFRFLRAKRRLIRTHHRGSRLANW